LQVLPSHIIVRWKVKDKKRISINDLVIEKEDIDI
jgi:hypothetical protein